jgi:hypothetical protein
MAKVFRGTSVHIVSHTRGTWPLQRPARSIPAVHRFLADYRWLANDLQGRPTRIAEVVPHKVQCVGACDAAGSGMGGVQFIPLPSGALQPILWRAPFTQSLQDMLVSYSSPSGTITNSDLELAGTIAHHADLAQQYDIRKCTIHTLCDNTRLSAGRPKALAPPSALELICCASKLSTSDSTDTSPSIHTLWARPTKWPTSALELGTFLTANYSRTLTPPSRSRSAGKFAKSHRQCSPPCTTHRPRRSRF